MAVGCAYAGLVLLDDVGFHGRQAPRPLRALRLVREAAPGPGLGLPEERRPLLIPALEPRCLPRVLDTSRQSSIITISFFFLPLNAAFFLFGSRFAPLSSLYHLLLNKLVWL